MVARAFSSAGVPVMKEPTGLTRSGNKRSYSLTLVPWSCGKALTWDVTVATSLAASYIVSSARSSGSVAETAAARKRDKYSELPASYSFYPIAIKTLGPINSSAIELLGEVGKRISLVSGELRETKFLFQRLSIIIHL